MENVKHIWFRLKKSTAKGVLIYLTLLVCLSGVGLFIILIPEMDCFKLAPFSFAIVGGIISSILGSTIFYSRKLYKACISLDMVEPDGKEDSIRQMGIMFYYILRPLYSACLSIIVVIATKSGADFITDNGQMNNNFPYLVMIICFFVGYSSGDFIDILEERGKKVVQGVFKADS